MEILTPFPGAGNDRTLRLYGFVDAGMIGGTNNGSLYSADANSLRVSTGVGISWISPVGPLRLAFAKPLRKFDGDRIQAMQFQIGTSF
jgi:outer membrane protein insertion porin family